MYDLSYILLHEVKLLILTGKIR